MLKKLLFCALSLSLLQCTAGVDEPAIKPTQVEHEANPYERTAEQAVKVLRELMFKPEFRAMRAEREIAGVVDLSTLSEFRSTQGMSEFSQNFHAVEFKNNQGYAIVSKDLRTFPIFAVLDRGSVRDKVFTSPEMQSQIEKMMAGFKMELKLHEEATALRSTWGDPRTNHDYARDLFLEEGWQITREAAPRLETEWNQTLDRPQVYLNEQGASFREVYGMDDPDIEPEVVEPKVEPKPKKEDEERRYSCEWGACTREEYLEERFRSIGVGSVDAAGCTPVAFGQVMYALRNCPGFSTLRYDNGERVKWDRMVEYNDKYSDTREVRRFLGWIAASCSFMYTSEGTIVFNIKATEFLRKRLGNYIHSRYDNCVFTEGDFDGYGWSEDRRIADEFFDHPKCFVIMTASSAKLSLLNFHTYVVDGMIEFKKRYQGTGLFGWGIFRKTHDGVRHLYHINPGWGRYTKGYYLYVQNVDDIFGHIGDGDYMNYRSNLSYLIVRPR